MNSFTKYSSVNLILDLLLRNVFAILGNQFLGMYIHGSLALDDFVPDRSDIDLVVVTKTIIPDDLLVKLKLMHKKISSSKMQYAKRIECVYIPIDFLKNYVQEKAYFPCLHVGGNFYTDGFGLIEKHVLREKGIVLKGQSTKSFIKPVNSSELKQAAIESLKNWWFRKLKDHSKLFNDDYQVYAILTMCRALYTVQKGEIVSKTTAAQYAKRTIGKKWSVLIDKALLWQMRDKFNHLEETLEFIEFTLNKAGIK